MNKINYKPKGLFKELTIVQVHFGIHKKSKPTNEDIFVSRGWINIYVDDDEFPEFDYNQKNK